MMLAVAAALAAGCSAIYPDSAQEVSVEWAAPGALVMPGARGVRVGTASIIGNDADATSLAVTLGLGQHGDADVVTLGLRAVLGLELLTLGWGRTPPEWSRYVSAAVGIGAGLVYSGDEDGGFGGYVETEAALTCRLAVGCVLAAGYRGTVYAARECGGSHGPFVRLGLNF